MLDTAFWVTTGAILVLLSLSAFFSGSETALTASSRGKLRAQADRGSRGAELALKITEDNERLIGSVLLGNNLVKILSASLATALLTRILGSSGVALATLVMTCVVLIFAEVLPKTYAITNAEAVAVRVAPAVRVAILLFAPLVAAVRALVRLILRVFGVGTDPDSHILVMREEIVDALTLGHSEGVVEKEDRDRILGALDLADRAVEEVMLHRSQIETIDVDLPPTEIVARCLASTHTRLPLYRGEPENIVGVIHAKDLLRAIYALRAAGAPDLGGFDVIAAAKEPYFIPETTNLDEQMRQFLLRRTHFALVVDEYGALRGLITLEDIIEEIVGDITDEFDREKGVQIRRTDAGDWIVDGGMTLRDLNRETDWNLPDDEANTVAGLVIHEAQTIPTAGQVFSFHGFRFEVLARKDNRITRLKVRPLQALDPG